MNLLNKIVNYFAVSAFILLCVSSEHSNKDFEKQLKDFRNQFKNTSEIFLDDTFDDLKSFANGLSDSAVILKTNRGVENPSLADLLDKKLRLVI